jgi:hypothetical protein
MKVKDVQSLCDLSKQVGCSPYFSHCHIANQPLTRKSKNPYGNGKISHSERNQTMKNKKILNVQNEIIIILPRLGFIYTTL